MHSVDVDGVELPSPLLAEAQLIDCVISAPVWLGQKNGIAAEGSCCVHQSPYLPTCKAKGNEGVFAAEEPSHSPRIIRFSV